MTGLTKLNGLSCGYSLILDKSGEAFGCIRRRRRATVACVGPVVQLVRGRRVKSE